MRRLKYVVSLRRARAEGAHEARPYVGLENVESWTGRLVDSATLSGSRSATATQHRAQGHTFEAGDVLFGKLRPYLAKAWLAEFPGRSTTEFLVLQPGDVEPRFLKYLCLRHDFIHAVGASTSGSKMPRAEWTHIGNLPVPVPPRRLQQEIADYLDLETARIDASISAEERLLRLLNERRQAVVTNTVARGLDPDVTLKDTGISWLGDGPANWQKWKLGHLGRVGNGSTPSRSNTKYWLGGSVPWLNSAVVNQDEVIASEQYVTKTALAECHLPILGPGTVLVAITGQGKTRGQAVVLSTEATINQHLAFVDPDPERLDAWFLRWWLFAAYSFLRSISDDAGGTKGALTCMDVANLRILLPPLGDQIEIREHIAREIAEIERARDAAERAIALLKERRSAVVAAGVTGQIDVGSAA